MPQKTSFAPQLIIGHGVIDISFYNSAFGANELRRWTNEDGSIHVAELEIDGALFHLHEEAVKDDSLTHLKKSPDNAGGTTVLIGLMVEDVHAIFEKAVTAGAKVISQVTDYDYKYRQGEIVDPFGHHWLIEKILS